MIYRRHGGGMIVGMGIDIIEVDRIRTLLQRSGDRFFARWFDAEEIAYCRAKARPHRHLAARLAAKEAVVKALGPAWEGPILYREIMVVVTESGAPRIRVAGRVAELARAAGVATFHVSLSHGGRYAVASVIAER
jgi:holo-[acyl-carrier protein] synthase